ncbi:MAG: three-Cys-motif partner protein TcmP [Candidatus Binataceae bacterium]
MKHNSSDGLPARAGRAWSREKLIYLKKYASAFMVAMGPKRSEGRWERLVYIDLLAGQGRGIDPDTKQEFDGSPLIALSIQPKFDHLFLADDDPKKIEVLKARIPPADRTRVTVSPGDCNKVVDQVIAAIHGGTLGLAFMDPEGFEVDFDTLAKLAKRRIDLVYLFPDGIGWRRNLRQREDPLTARMDKSWGGEEWRKLASENIVPAFQQKMLNSGFKFQDEADSVLTNTKKSRMYHLLYFTHDSAGLKIWNGIKQIEPSGQRKLLL